MNIPCESRGPYGRTLFVVPLLPRWLRGFRRFDLRSGGGPTLCNDLRHVNVFPWKRRSAENIGAWTMRVQAPNHLLGTPPGAIVPFGVTANPSDTMPLS